MKRLLALAAWGLAAAAEPRLFYSKSFPGSTPEFVAIALARNGEAEYREAADDDRPLKFRLRQSEAGEIFALAEKLGWFSRPLESPLKVAFMGMKTFGVERGGRKTEVKFNFSEDLDARALADWFERITESEQHLIALERAAKYDRLGINRAVLQFESAWTRNRLVALDQYLPILDRIAKNEVYLHMARQRAAALGEAIRAK
ncbi:MAG: hypothetical protein FJW37_10995 [Acidobacteria bacterium]|nr:hypothetical protein [Acidobacteriota bacterium]